MSCGTIIIPPLDRPSDDITGVVIPEWESALKDWSWIPVEVPQYNPPVLEDLTLGAQPPSVPDIPFADVDKPYVAPEGSITPPVFGAPPVLDAVKPVIYEPNQPEDFTGNRPGDAPTVTDVDIPPAPVIVVPDAPLVSDVVLPAPIDINLPVFDGQMPDGSDIHAPDNTFFFEEEAYSSAVLDRTTEEILRMFDGRFGIPDTTWQLILQQGIDNEENSGNKLIEETISDWASRGWSAPGGVLDMRVREARQSIFTGRNTLARETTIKEAEMELDNIKYTVAQGIALESVLINLHNSAQDRGLKAAELGVTIAIQIMEAKIALYNSELQAYQTSATVFKTLIDAEMVKVEVYKAELEASALTIEVDKAKIEAYNSYINGLNAIVELHNSQIRAVLGQVQIETAKIEAYKATVSAYAEEVRAWGLEWDGYKKSWDGQETKAGIYKTAVDAYASEVAGYGEVAKVEEIKVDAESKTIQLNIERMRSDTGRYAAEVDYQSARSESIAKTYSSQMDGYRANVAHDGNRISVYEAKLNGDIANARAMSAAAIENARIVASQLEAIQRINVSMDETIAKVNGQLAASKLGQFNSSTSLSSSFATSYKYDCTV